MKKKTALEKANSQIKKADRVSSPKALKTKLTKKL